MRIYLLAVTLLLACGGGSDLQPSPALEGDWDLRTLDGGSLPQRGIVSGRVTLIGTDRGTARVAWCDVASFSGPSLVSHLAHWAAVGERATIRYTDLQGAFQPVDTVQLVQGRLRLHTRLLGGTVNGVVPGVIWQLDRMAADPPRFTC